MQVSICQEIHKTKFPIKLFARKFPGEIAEVIAFIAGFDRPIQDAIPFQSIEAYFPVRLSEVVPKVTDGELEWFEWSGMVNQALKRRRLRLDSAAFSLIE